MPTSAERAARARKAHARGRPDRRLLLSGAAAGVLLLAAGGLFLLSLGGDSTAKENIAGAASRRTPGSTPTTDFSRRAGGLSEGAVILSASTPSPPPGELRADGGTRFALPLASHAGIEDYFGSSRLYGQVHGGIDFSLRGLTDAAVLAACPGTVSKPDRSETLGLHVILNCGDGWEAITGFLASSELSGGEVLARGQVLGRGQAGEHLHFELRYQGFPIDPEGYIDIPKRVPNTPTPIPTSTPPPTSTAAATSTAAQGATAPPASTPTPGPTATPTNTPTATATPTITPTPTWTPTPTRTPVRPTPTRTPPIASQ